MEGHNESGKRRVSRRTFLTIGTGALTGALVNRLWFRRTGVSATPRDNCYWQSYQTVCINHQLRQYRCEICCAGGVCEQVRCAWFTIGSC